MAECIAFTRDEYLGKFPSLEYAQHACMTSALWHGHSYNASCWVQHDYEVTPLLHWYSYGHTFTIQPSQEAFDAVLGYETTMPSW